MAYVFRSGGQTEAAPKVRPRRWSAHWRDSTGYGIYQPLTCPPPPG